MSCFIHVTDTHFRTKSPVNRTDDILESLFEKFEYVLKYAAELNAKVIHSGDLFHTPNVPDFVATRVVRLFKKYSSEVYFIIGNHDVTGANCDTYDYSKIGLMAEYKWFKLLGKKPAIFKDCVLAGYDFSKAMECPEIIDPIKDFNLPESSLPVICCVHSMIVDEPAMIIGGKNKTINWGSINSTASVILTGHFHPGWDGIKTSAFGTDFVNPGALIRQEASKLDMDRKPKISILEIVDNKVKIKFKVVPHKKTVFNRDLILNRHIGKIERSQFIEALAELKDEDMMGSNVLKLLDNINNSDIDKDLVTTGILEMCKKKILEVMQNG